MSRSYNQRHGCYPRKKKHLPYGSVRCANRYGGETYSPKYGEWCDFVISKSKERRKIKLLIKDIL